MSSGRGADGGGPVARASVISQRLAAVTYIAVGCYGLWNATKPDDVEVQVAVARGLSGPVDGRPSLTGRPGDPIPVLIDARAVQGTGDAATVFLIRGGTVKKRIVRLGPLRRDGQIVVEGLQVGAEVAMADGRPLADGMQVRAIP